MMPVTNIEWTDRAWPVVNGCRRKSPGCVNCWAERLVATRLRNHPRYKGLAVYTENGPRWTGETRLALDILDEPLRVRTPEQWFVANKADLFGEGVADADIAAIFGVMSATSWHTHQVLTKEPARAREWFERMGSPSEALARVALELGRHGVLPPKQGLQFQTTWPLPNVQLGASVEDQEWAEKRIVELVAAPAALHWISAEPLLGPLDISPFLDWFRFMRWVSERYSGRYQCKVDDARRPPIDWVVVGGESGPGARRCEVAWIRSLVEQCRTAGVAVFVKQLGANVIDRNDRFDTVGDSDDPRDWPFADRDPDDVEHNINGFREEYQGAPVRVRLRDRKGADPSEWPPDLRVREFPRVAGRRAA
jgi:protein gp37